MRQQIMEECHCGRVGGNFLETSCLMFLLAIGGGKGCLQTSFMSLKIAQSVPLLQVVGSLVDHHCAQYYFNAHFRSLMLQ